MNLLEGNESLASSDQNLDAQAEAEKHVYFPKFLTSSSLTELQLRYSVYKMW